MQIDGKGFTRACFNENLSVVAIFIVNASLPGTKDIPAIKCIKAELNRCLLKIGKDCCFVIGREEY